MNRLACLEHVDGQIIIIFVAHLVNYTSTTALNSLQEHHVTIHIMRPAPVEFVSITFASLFECQVCGAKVNDYLICNV
jgi:hypothetical protein